MASCQCILSLGETALKEGNAKFAEICAIIGACEEIRFSVRQVKHSDWVNLEIVRIGVPAQSGIRMEIRDLITLYGSRRKEYHLSYGEKLHIRVIGSAVVIEFFTRP